MEILKQLYRDYTGHEVEVCRVLTPAGSPRRYYRLGTAAHTVVGVVGTAQGENEAFIAIARQMRSKGLPVPEVYAVSADRMCYLQEDLGDTSLFDPRLHRPDPRGALHRRGAADPQGQSLPVGLRPDLRAPLRGTLPQDSGGRRGQHPRPQALRLRPFG